MGVAEGICMIPSKIDRTPSSKISDVYLSESGTTIERIFTDGGDGCGDLDAGEPGAICERSVTDGGDGCGDLDAG